MIPWERATDFYSVCMDNTEDGVCKGRLYHRYLSGPLMFQNLDDLIFQINELCNQIGVPEAWERFRGKRVSERVGNHLVEVPRNHRARQEGNVLDSDCTAAIQHLARGSLLEREAKRESV